MKTSDFSLEEMLPVLCEVIQSGGEFRLYPKGTSMLPLLRQGRDSVALVSARAPCTGQIYLYRRKNGQFVLHRLEKIERDGTLTFRGDNQTLLERGVAKEALIARVAAVYREDKRLEDKAARLVLYKLFALNPAGRFLRFLPRNIKRKIKKDG